MGDWNITIRGTGAHHNQNYPKDADKMAAQFVKDLKGAGHIVKDATITAGSETSLIPNEPPPAPPEDGK